MMGPKVFRAMQESGGAPVVGRSRRSLGVVVAPAPEGDIEADASGNVHPKTGGMSVAPTYADLPIWRVPKRLASKIRGAKGSNADKIWSFGIGAFRDGRFDPGLVLRVDRPGHGNVEPDASCSLEQYERNLAATQSAWKVDEP